MAYVDDTIGRMGNAVSTDYSVAIRRAVKIIQYHGWNDQTLQPAYSTDYYEQVAKAGVLPQGLDYKKSYTLQFVNKGVGLDLRPK